MKPLRGRASLALVVLLCTGCPLRKSSPPPQAQAPPLQTGNGTLSPPKTETQEKATSPLASPLPAPSAQSVPLPPPPPPKKVRKRVKPKPVDTTQTASAAGTQAAPAASLPTSQATPSPIGQLTTGDSAAGERTKRETADLIAATEQGLNGIKRPLSEEEKVTAAQIHTFLKQAQTAMENGDTDGGHTLATKAKLLLDELTKP
jgi:hypothetical protein